MQSVESRFPRQDLSNYVFVSHKSTVLQTQKQFLRRLIAPKITPTSAKLSSQWAIFTVNKLKWPEHQGRLVSCM